MLYNVISWLHENMAWSLAIQFCGFISCSPYTPEHCRKKNLSQSATFVLSVIQIPSEVFEPQKPPQNTVWEGVWSPIGISIGYAFFYGKIRHTSQRFNWTTRPRCSHGAACRGLRLRDWKSRSGANKLEPKTSPTSSKFVPRMQSLKVFWMFPLHLAPELPNSV
jgi:hypothetical protein